MTEVTFRSPFRMIRCMECMCFIARGSRFRNTKKKVLPETCVGVQRYLLQARCPRCKAAIVISTVDYGYRIESGAFEVVRGMKADEESAEEKLSRLVEKMNQEALEGHHQKSNCEREQGVKDDNEEHLVAVDATADIYAVKAQQEGLQGLMREICQLLPLTGEEEEALDATVFRANRKRVKELSCILDDSRDAIDRSKGNAAVEGCSTQLGDRVKMNLATYVRSKRQRV